MAKRCRICRCTDDDCSVCILRTGWPCHWVADDLCSACEAKPLLRQYARVLVEPDPPLAPGDVFTLDDIKSGRSIRYRVVTVLPGTRDFEVARLMDAESERGT